jgi:hypothetical protein
LKSRVGKSTLLTARKADPVAVSVLLRQENDFEIGHSLSASKRIAMSLIGQVFIVQKSDPVKCLALQSSTNKQTAHAKAFRSEMG